MDKEALISVLDHQRIFCDATFLTRESGFLYGKKQMSPKGKKRIVDENFLTRLSASWSSEVTSPGLSCAVWPARQALANVERPSATFA